MCSDTKEKDEDKIDLSLCWIGIGGKKPCCDFNVLKCPGILWNLPLNLLRCLPKHLHLNLPWHQPPILPMCLSPAVLPKYSPRARPTADPTKGPTAGPTNVSTVTTVCSSEYDFYQGKDLGGDCYKVTGPGGPLGKNTQKWSAHPKCLGFNTIGSAQ